MLSSLLQNHEVGHYSGYKTRVFAAYFFEIVSRDDLTQLTQIYHDAHEAGLPILIIGGGTNILFASDRFAGVVIKNSLTGWQYNQDTQILQAYSDVSISDIAVALEQDFGQALWHRFIGLPGSIGGAVFGNAGCFGLETESNFAQATIYDMQSGGERILRGSNMQFGYRDSLLKKTPEFFLIDATFDLSANHEKYHSDVDNIDFREHKQPKGNSCGSFFKNPSRDVSAGSLIEQVGLKGHHHGGAYWSPLHANFLMSDGESCLPTDLIELVRLTQDRVKKETGHELINEVRIIA